MIPEGHGTQERWSHTDQNLQSWTSQDSALGSRQEDPPGIPERVNVLEQGSSLCSPLPGLPAKAGLCFAFSSSAGETQPSFLPPPACLEVPFFERRRLNPGVSAQPPPGGELPPGGSGQHAPWTTLQVQRCQEDDTRNLCGVCRRASFADASSWNRITFCTVLM